MTRPVCRQIAALIASCLLAVGLAAQVPLNYVTQGESLPCLEKRFSLRVHVNDTPDGPQPFDTAAFASMVERANAAFAPICVQFEVCEYLRVENYRYHSHENHDADELIVLEGDPNRIDVYVPAIDSSEFVCGRASLNGIDDNANSYVMVVGSCIAPGGTTLAHELGHYFNLYHTFETDFGAELVDSTNCATAGDLVCDTPADPYIIGSPIQWVSPLDPCRFVYAGVDDRSRFYIPHTANIMSYYDESCHCGFTRGQLARMAAACIAADPDRVW